MNLKKLTTLLFAGVTAATPFATNAQNPTILQGNYISNVFGQANFVLNPNAQTNVANVTLTNATATRSTTTPLVATSEWNVTVTSANGTAAWATRSFDAGMKNQNCEARFTYRGFQATSKAQIKQGANVVAELVLTPSATDPRIASINFPCGDLSSATTFVITDTATLAGTNEIGGIYVGLATNQANVAQAEFVGSVQMYGCSTDTTTSGTVGVNWESFPAVSGCSFSTKGKALAPTTNIPAIRFTNLPAGNYQIVTTGSYGRTGALGYTYFRVRTTDNAFISEAGMVGTNTNESFYLTGATYNLQITNSGAKTIEIQGLNNGSSRAVVGVTGAINTFDNSTISVYRFPSSSELVVTPETQNVWGAVKYNGNTDFGGTSTSYAAVPDSGLGARSLLGNAQLAGSACGLSSGDTGFCLQNVPPGKYEVSANISAGPSPTAVNDTCQYRIEVNDGSTTQYAVDMYARTTSATYGQYFPMGTGVVTIPSFAQNVSVVLKYKVHQGSPLCLVRSANTAATITQPTITFKPIDNASNSALYVQGPVKAAATGTAIPAGFQGQKITVVGTDVTPANVTTTSFANTGVLPAGIWSCSASVQVHPNAGSFSVAYLGIGLANNDLGPQRQNIIPPSPGNYVTRAQVSRFQISSTGSTTVHATVFFQAISGSPSPSVTGADSGLECVRVN